MSAPKQSGKKVITVKAYGLLSTEGFHDFPFPYIRMAAPDGETYHPSSIFFKRDDAADAKRGSKKYGRSYPVKIVEVTITLTIPKKK